MVEQLNERAALLERADRITKDQDFGHTRFQIIHFIIGKAGPTTYGMLKQARREIRSRAGALRYRRVGLMRRAWRWMARGGAATPPRPKRSTEFRELTVLVELAEELEQRLRTENPDGVDMDQLDAEFWRVRITRMAVIEVLATGRMSINSLETLATMPALVRERTLRALSEARQVKNDREAMVLIDQTALRLPE